MAGIDYNIANQIKGIQLEPPENAMMRAMQLRGLQEASQMNALKQQEYQQDVAEKNALAQIYANPNLKYGSPEFFAEVSRRAPRYFEKIATGEQQRQLALSTQQTREQQREEVAQKQRLAKREFGLRKIAGAPDYAQAVSLIERGIRTGEIDREEGDDMLSRLNPDTDIRQFRSDVLTNLLPADKALTAASDIEKANLGVRKEKTEVEVKELDQALTGFNKTFNPAFISTTDKNVGRAQVTQRLTAMYDHDKLGAEAAKFMPLEQALKQHLAAYDADSENYVATVMNLSGDKIIEMRQKTEEQRKAKQKQAYLDYVFDATEKGEDVMTEAEFVASLNQQPATAVATARVTPAAASTTTAAPTAVATTAPDGTKELPSVEIIAGTYGVHPQARAFYRAGNKVMGDAIQAAHVAEKKRLEEEKKRGELSGEFLNVVNAEQMIADLEKNPTPLNLKKIASLRKQINAANLGKGTNVHVGVKMPEGVKAVDQKYAQDYLDWTQGGGADAAANAAQIKSVLDRFANGEVLSGPSIGMAPDFFNALVNPEALNAKQQIEEVVQRNLRAVLGAQFTQVEGERLISRAFDARLKPQENAKRLRKLFMQIQTAAQQKQAMAEYYEKNETLRGFKGKAPNMNDFFNVLNAPDAPPKGSVDVMVDGKMHRCKSQADLEAYKAKGGKVDK